MGIVASIKDRVNYLRGIELDSDNNLVAGYRKLPSRLQTTELEHQYKEWRDDEYWNLYGNKYLKDAGIGFTTSPWTTAWESIWGASPVQDLEKYKELSQKVPYIYSALMMQANLAVARGFQIDYDGPEEVSYYIEDFMQEHDMKNMLKLVVYDMLRYGSSYVEVVRKWSCLDCSFQTDRIEEVQKHLSTEGTSGHHFKNPYGEITYLKPLDPCFMRVRRNPWGIVLGYLQLLTTPPVTFTADEIIHFRFNAMSDQYENAYGNSLLRALLYHQELINEFEKNMAGIMNTYLKPLLVVKIGKSEPGAPAVTDDQYTAVVNAFRNRRSATDIYVRQGGLIDDIIVIQPPVQGLQASQWWLDYLKEQREFELGVPRIFAGDPTGTNRATAQVLLQNFTTRLTNVQDSMSDLIENMLFLPLLKQKYKNWQELINEYGIPQLSWNNIIDEDPVQNLSVVVGMAKIGAITYNEARTRIGLPELDERKFGNKGEELIEIKTNSPDGGGGFSIGKDAGEAAYQEKENLGEETGTMGNLVKEAQALHKTKQKQLLVDANKPVDIVYKTY